MPVRIRKWVILLILTSLYFMVYFHRVAPAIIAPDLQAAFSINAVALGWLSSAYFYLYAGFQVPIGVLTDTWGPRNVILVFTLLASLGSFVFAFAPTFEVATMARLVVGAGVAGVYVPTLKVLSRWFKGSEFATITGVVIAIGNLGAFGASTPLAYVASTFGWRSAFIWVATMTLVFTILAWALVRDKTPEEQERPDAWLTTMIAYGKETLHTPGLLKLGLCGLGKYGPLMAYQGLWGALFLTNIYNLNLIEAGNILMAVSLGYTIGGPLLGFLSDRVFRGRRKVLLSAIGVFFLCWLPLIIKTDSLTILELYLISGVLGVTGGGTAVLMFSMAKESVAPHLSGTAIAIVNTFSFFAVVLFQPVTGYIISLAESKVLDMVGAYRLAALICGMGALISLLASFRLSETYGRSSSDLPSGEQKPRPAGLSENV